MIDLEISKAGGRLFRYAENIVDAAGASIASATVALKMYRANGDRFDWSDKTFKSSGWTTGTLTVSYVAGSTYYVSTSIEQSGGTVDFSDGDVLRVEGQATVSSVVYDLDTRLYLCVQKITAGAFGGGRSEIVRAGSASLLRVYAVDGTTVLEEFALLDGTGTALTTTGPTNVSERRGAPT